MIYSAYVHIPFCTHRCHYCDFNTYTGMKGIIPDYVSALVKEIRIVSNKKSNINLHSIYFGGGTPSLISSDLIYQIISCFRNYYFVTEDCEISIETNPGTLTYGYLKCLRQAGVNRLSIGVQSTDSFDLVRLERTHNLNDILNSIRFARKAGFDNINLDLIFGLPWQDITGWGQSLSRALALKPEHFSLYSLIIEPGTLLFNWHQKGLVALQDQDLEGDMYQYAMDSLDAAGYEHYEISNWAKRHPYHNYQSRHNKQYWLNQPYLGFGAGAHGYASDVRTVNVRTIPEYIKRINQSEKDTAAFPASPAIFSTTRVDQRTQMKDFMMLGLRLVKEGVSLEKFKSCYGKPLMGVFGKEIQTLLDRGIIEWAGEGKHHLRLSRRGIMVANQAFIEFI